MYMYILHVYYSTTLYIVSHCQSTYIPNDCCFSNYIYPGLRCFQLCYYKICSQPVAKTVSILYIYRFFFKLTLSNVVKYFYYIVHGID